LRPGSAASSAAGPESLNNVAVDVDVAGAGGGGGSSARRPFIYSKQVIMSLRDEEYCVCRPEDLPGEIFRSHFTTVSVVGF
jgi:hypothetical protein